MSDALFTLIFLAEAITKISRMGWGPYWSQAWNKFDFIVLVIALPSLANLFIPDSMVTSSVLALRAKVPILPVYIQSKPKLFRVNHVYIGKPMDISDLAAQGFNTDVVEALCARIRDTFRQLRADVEKK